MIAIPLNTEFTINIITTQPTAPAKAVCQQKNLNVGLQTNYLTLKQKFSSTINRSIYLKFGAEARSKAMQATFTPKYERRKKIEVIWAIVFSAPIRRTS